MSGLGSSYMLDGRLVSGAAPNAGDVMTWDAVLGCWRPVQPGIIVIPPTLNQDYYLDGATGSDTLNTGLTKTSPLATLAGFFAKYGTEVPLGARRRIHLAGTGGADPWETPVTQQVYGADEIDLGINGPIGNRTVFRGPTNMILGTPATGPATAALDALPGGVQVCLETDVANPAGQRTRFNFVGAAPGWTPQDLGVAGRGYKLRITRAGVKVVFECPIADNGANFIILDHAGFQPLILATDTVEIVFPAARIRGATDFGGGARVLTIRGQGADILSLAALTAADQGHNFERLVLDSCFTLGQNVSYDRCCFIAGPMGGPGIQGTVHYSNSMVVQAVTDFSRGGGHIELPGFVNPRPDAVANPIDQAIYIGSVHNSIVVGGSGGNSGYYTADFNLSVYGSPAAGITLRSGAQFLQRATCLYLGGSANTTMGIQASNGSQATVLAIGGGGTATEIIGGGNALQVDTNAGIAYGAGAGAFGDAASYNGNYHITNGATWTGRMSVIHRP